MDRSFRRYGFLLAVLALVAVVTIPTTGCKQLMIGTALLVKGTDVDADYDGLKDKRVVVVCRPVATHEYSDSHVAQELAREIALLLRTNVSKVKVVSQSKVDEWTDVKDWTEFAEVGRGLNADMVVGVELRSFKLRQNQILFQGKADTLVKVIDCKQNQIVFERQLPQLVFPPNSAVETSSMAENEFRRRFVGILADQIARHFYPHDPHADCAMDAKLLD